MSDLEFTGERLIPEKSPPRLEAEHRSRYEFALRYIEGRNVLDIGCGEGYGSYMMIGTAKSVTGVDIDENAISGAKENYEASNLNFAVSDVTKLPFPDKAFSACVCFEVIEHIENPELLAAEAERVLEPSGIFIITTPNGAVRVSSQPNPFHVKEYSIDEFRRILASHFPSDKWSISIFGQFQKGKNYTTGKVLFKNLYLGLKGKLGIKPEEEAQNEPGRSKSQPMGYEFYAEHAELAEYLVAVVLGKAG